MGLDMRTSLSVIFVVIGQGSIAALFGIQTLPVFGGLSSLIFELFYLTRPLIMREPRKIEWLELSSLVLTVT